MNIDYNLIDEKCIPLVKFFNSIGLETQFSCSGHEENDNGVFHIMFSEKVTDKDIENLIIKYSNKYNHSPFLGKFMKWVRKLSGEIKYLKGVFEWTLLMKQTG